MRRSTKKRKYCYYANDRRNQLDTDPISKIKDGTVAKAKLCTGVKNWQGDIASKSHSSDELKQEVLFEELIASHRASTIADDNKFKVRDERGQNDNPPEMFRIRPIAQC